MELILSALLTCAQSQDAIHKVYQNQSMTSKQKQEVIQQIVLITKKDCFKKCK